LHRFDTIAECDRRTNGQTDMQTDGRRAKFAKLAVRIASF